MWFMGEGKLLSEKKQLHSVRGKSEGAPLFFDVASLVVIIFF